jgi:hypothetical protein
MRTVFVVNEPQCMTCGLPAAECRCFAPAAPPATVPTYPPAVLAIAETPLVAPVYNWGAGPMSVLASSPAVSASAWGGETPLTTNSTDAWNAMFREDVEQRRAANNRGRRRGAR